MPASSRSPAPLALAILGSALVIALLVFLPRGSEPEPAPGPPSQSGPGADPAPPRHPTPIAPRTAPAEHPLPAEVSRQSINAITTSAQAATTHRILTEELMTCLEQLATTHDQARIRVATQELAERFYLLDRVVAAKRLETPGPGSLGAQDRPRIDALQRLWQENPDLSLAVDLLFTQRELLIDEHVPLMLRRWMESDPAE